MYAGAVELEVENHHHFYFPLLIEEGVKSIERLVQIQRFDTEGYANFISRVKEFFTLFIAIRVSFFFHLLLAFSIVQ